MKRLLTILLAATAAQAHAQSVCASDDVAQPAAVLERFVNADCDACWRDPATPKPGPGEIALDWIVPGSKGDDAPLSIGATRNALARLQALARPVPAQTDAVRSARVAPVRGLRIAQGEPVNDYIGTSIELKPAPAGPWHAWLLLVEQLPAGAEGSPVPRNLVRNAFQPPWSGNSPRRQLEEARAMQIADGAKPSRLRLVALLQDAHGRMRAIVRNECRE